MTKGKSTIEVQMDKIFSHARQGSFGTRARYEDSCKEFVNHLKNEFNVQNIKNISDKHIVSFIKSRQEEGISPKTLKNDLSAIRYLHDQIPNAKHQLSSNADLKKNFNIDLDKTPQINGDRGWTDKEYKDFIDFAKSIDRVDVADVAILARTMGLRIAEASLVSRAQAEKALRTNVYEVKGEAKNGKWRTVPLSPEAREVFERRLADLERGQRLFVKAGEKSHHVINRFEKFLENHRERIETQEGRERRRHKGKERSLTWHGLRYRYVQDRVEQERKKGRDLEQASAIVTQEVGHNRLSVIGIYLGKSIKKA